MSRPLVEDLRAVAAGYESSNPALCRLLNRAAKRIVDLDPVDSDPAYVPPSERAAGKVST